MLRDVQVCAIWEGTTNLLANDFAKTMNSMDRLEAFGTRFRKTMHDLVASEGKFLNKNKEVLKAYGKLIFAYNNLYSDLHELVNSPKEAFPRLESSLRKLSYGFA